MKQNRHRKILKILAETDVKTQEQLTDELKNSGFKVTQATVSHDIKELGLIKLPLSDGSYKYAVTKEEKNESREHLTIFSKSIFSIQAAMHTIVVKTSSGMANAVAASLDTFIGHDVVGTIAGDDTLLIIMENPESADKMAAKLRRTFSWKD